MSHKFLLKWTDIWQFTILVAQHGRTTWSHNLKCHTTHVAPTVHTTTTTTCFMSHNHVVPSRTTNCLSVWTHLYNVLLTLMYVCIHSHLESPTKNRGIFEFPSACLWSLQYTWARKNPHHNMLMWYSVVWYDFHLMLLQMYAHEAICNWSKIACTPPRQLKLQTLSTMGMHWTMLTLMGQ